MFGKFDYMKSGRKLNSFEVTVELSGKKGNETFSACGKIYNATHTDIWSGGQNLDTMAEFLKGNPVFDEIYDLWKKYHMNDLHAGSYRQEKALEEESERRNAAHRERGEKEENPLTYASRYDEAVEYLKSIGLYVVELEDGESVEERDYEIDGVNYHVSAQAFPYGAGWVHRRLSGETIQRVMKLTELAEKNGVYCENTESERRG